jgi:putative FmdB family regulatory protein
MPIYEFHCEQCKRDSEILVRSSKWKGTKCPHCGSGKLAKKLSVFASSTGGSNSELAPCGNPAAACASGGSCCCGGGPHRH